MNSSSPVWPSASSPCYVHAFTFNPAWCPMAAPVPLRLTGQDGGVHCVTALAQSDSEKLRFGAPRFSVPLPACCGHGRGREPERRPAGQRVELSKNLLGE
jgi:hypothetical protein